MSSDEEEEYQIDKILKSRGTGKKREFYVSWEGYDEKTWEPAVNLHKDLVADWEAAQDADVSSDEEYEEKAAKKKPTPSAAGKRKAEAEAPTSAAPPVKKRVVTTTPKTTNVKDLIGALGILEAKQIADVVVSLVKDGLVDATDILTRLPGTDVSKDVTACDKEVRKIFRAMPRYASGNSFCYNRCKSAVASAKRSLLDGVKKYKTSGQWALALEFVCGALPVAESMPMWDAPDNNKGRCGAIEALRALEIEARKRLPAAHVVD